MFSLTRNIGNAVGIAMLQREYLHYTAATRARLVEGVRPDNPVFPYANPDFNFGSAPELAGMSGEISRQAAMVGNIEVYWLVVFISIAMIPLVLFLRENDTGDTQEPLPAME
jgi:DHA2 family multidrug resistance protein